MLVDIDNRKRWEYGCYRWGDNYRLVCVDRDRDARDRVVDGDVGALIFFCNLFGSFSLQCLLVSDGWVFEGRG